MKQAARIALLRGGGNNYNSAGGESVSEADKMVLYTYLNLNGVAVSSDDSLSEMIGAIREYYADDNILVDYAGTVFYIKDRPLTRTSEEPIYVAYYWLSSGSYKWVHPIFIGKTAESLVFTYYYQTYTNNYTYTDSNGNVWFYWIASASTDFIGSYSAATISNTPFLGTYTETEERTDLKPFYDFYNLLVGLGYIK